jgi:hypothetical protein
VGRSKAVTRFLRRLEAAPPAEAGRVNTEFFEICCDAVRGAADGAELWQLMTAGELTEITYGEDEPDPSLPAAVLERAREWQSARAEDAALAVALAVRMTVRDPGRSFARDEYVQATPLEAQQVLSDALDFFADGLAGGAEPVRVASAHALGHCHSAAARALEVLGARRSEERAGRVLGTIALAIAALEVDRGTDGDAPIVTELARLCTHDDPFVALCAAVSVATLRGSVDAADLPSFVRAAAERAPLPPEWGWRWYPRDDTTLDLVARVLAWVPPPESPELLHAFAKQAPADGYPMDASFRLAFGEIDSPPRGGVRVKELSRDQKAVLRKLDGYHLSRLGLSGKRF